jgi:hypothetical protein
MRFAGKTITNRLVSMFDTDARPIRRGNSSGPTSSAITPRGRLCRVWVQKPCAEGILEIGVSA